MKIAIGSDHAGVDARRRMMEVLRGLGHGVMDLGPAGTESVDYPDYAAAVARAVAAGEADRGVLICGTGIGMSIAANKVRGVRAAAVSDEFAAEMSRRHNDANVLCLGARLSTPEKMERMVRIFLEAAFEGGRHSGRVAKIGKLEA